MQFTITAAKFRYALRFASAATQRREPIPILGMVMLRVTREKNCPMLTVKGSCIDVSFEVSVPLLNCGDSSWARCMNPVTLMKLLRQLDAADLVTVSIDKYNRAVMVCTPGKFRFMTVLPDDFPESPSRPLGELTSCVFDGNVDLLSELRRTMPFVSTEETRYYLNGICLSPKEDDHLWLVATNGHILTRRIISAPGIRPGVAPQIIVPALALRPLLREFPGGDGLRIVYTDKSVEFISADETHRVVTKTIDGTFPDWERVLPVPEAQTAALNIRRGESIKTFRMLRAISGLSDRQFTYAHRCCTIFKNGGGNLMAALSNAPDECAGIVEFPAEIVEGDVTQDHHFNIEYLLAILNAFGNSESVSFRVGGTDPAVFYDGDGAIAVLMPMRGERPDIKF